MDDRTETASREHTANRRGVLSNLTSGLALSVSIFALAIGAWQTRLMQGQARASVWPFVAIGYTYNSNTDLNGFIWHVDNNGVGPAKVQTVTLSVDGKPMKRWSDVIAELGVNHRTLNVSTTSLNGDVIPPNLNRETTIEAVRINERDVAVLFKAAIDRFKMDICYCSVYDECWVAHWQQSKVDAVEKCSSEGLVLFEE
jgi:hypothetical protein